MSGLSSVRGTQANFTVPLLTAAVHHNNPFTVTFVFAAVLASLSLATRRRNTMLLLALVAAMAIGMSSCGGGGGGAPGNPGAGGGGTPATPLSKTYKFTITGTSGTNTDSQVLTVTVQ